MREKSREQKVTQMKRPTTKQRPKTKTGQLPLKLKTGKKTDVRTQFAALCYREGEEGLEICLIKSRRTKRWIIPKGWPMHKQTPADAAATEAWEEAGLSGNAIDRCLGVYAYVKTMSTSLMPVIVMVYPVEVTEEHDDWPERAERKRKWFKPKKAAKRLAEPELRRIVGRFDPARLQSGE